MGMYTELIFGASIKEEAPDQVINALKYMIGELEEKPKDFPLPDGRCESLFRGGSYYFAVNKGVAEMRLDKITNEWVVSARSNIKNYEGEIQAFLDWIRPWVRQGSGDRDMYAVVMFELQEEPTIFYLR